MAHDKLYKEIDKILLNYLNNSKLFAQKFYTKYIKSYKQVDFM